MPSAELSLRWCLCSWLLLHHIDSFVCLHQMKDLSYHFSWKSIKFMLAGRGILKVIQNPWEWAGLGFTQPNDNTSTSLSCDEIYKLVSIHKSYCECWLWQLRNLSRSDMVMTQFPSTGNQSRIVEIFWFRSGKECTKNHNFPLMSSEERMIAEAPSEGFCSNRTQKSSYNDCKLHPAQAYQIMDQEHWRIPEWLTQKV